MSYLSCLHKAIVAVLACIAIGLGWDAYVLWFSAYPRATFCEASRELNRASNGLLALGYFSLGVHIFFLPWLPSWWRS